MQMSLCEYCRRLGALRWGSLRQPNPLVVGSAMHNQPTYHDRPFSAHHRTVEDFQKASLTCTLCGLLMGQFIAANGLEQLEYVLNLSKNGAELRLRVVRSAYDDFCTRWLEISYAYDSQHRNSWTSYPVLLRYEAAPHVTRNIWGTSDGIHQGFAASLPVVQEWMAVCDEHHTCCIKASGFFPKRLIWIDLSHDDMLARIVPGTEAAGRNSHYVALSYCWGLSGNSLKTTKATLPEHMKALPNSKLPKTHQDALVAAKLLGIPFLWIDALCIIQDDDADWHSQSLEMASIYRNAYVTIAAADSADANGGLFREPSPTLEATFEMTHEEHRNLTKRLDSDPLMPLEPWQVAREWLAHRRSKLGHANTYELKAYETMDASSEEEEEAEGHDRREPVIWIQKNRSDSKPVYAKMLMRRCPLLEELVADSKLSKRAWTLQETLLSTRLIYFTKDQLIWKCQRGYESEDGYIGSMHLLLERARFSSSLPTEKSHAVELDPRLDATQSFEAKGPGSSVNATIEFDSWWAKVEDYCSRTLTHRRDKFAAFAGITVDYQQANNTNIVAGLRTTTFSRDILWISKEQPPTTRTKLAGVPSWSWFAMDGPVQKFSAPANCIVRAEMDLIDAHVNWSGQQLTSWTVHGRLKVRGKLSTVAVNRASHDWSMFAGFRSDYYALKPPPQPPGSKQRACSGDCVFDATSPPDGLVFSCLLVTEMYNARNLTHYWNVLILESSGKHDDEYWRVGVGQVYDSYIPQGSATHIEFSDETPDKVITLV